MPEALPLLVPAEPIADYVERTGETGPIAIIIANARYKSKVIPNDRHAVGGAAAFFRYLRQGLGLPKGKILNLSDVRRKTFIDVFGKPGDPAGNLEKYMARVPASELIIYYAGRTMPVDGGQDVVLLTRDTIYDQPVKIGYRLSDLYRNLHALGVKRLRLYLDTSLSERMTGQPSPNSPPPSPVVTRPVIGPLGLQTPRSWVVISGLDGGADTESTGNSDGAITEGELISFVRNTVDVVVKKATRGSQTPDFFGKAPEILDILPEPAPEPGAEPSAPEELAPAGLQKSGSIHPSFDCRRARTKAEKAICANPAIATLDNVMVGLYTSARRTTKGRTRRALLARQKSWLKQRNACGADIGCLVQRYGKRIQQFQ